MILQIIYLNNHLYAVDKEAKPEEEELHIYTKYNPELHSHHWRNNEETCLKIVATTDPSLGLPLLPEIEEKWEDVFNKVFPKAHKLIEKNALNNLRDGFMEGYKAVKAKKYSEEDLLKFYKYVKTHTVEEALRHINPIPKSVEIEMEEYCEDKVCTCTSFSDGQKACEFPEYKPKVDKNNYVTVEKWIW